MKLIEIVWEGPYSFTEVCSKYEKTDYGVYQIYGTHNILGENILVYIGKTEEQTFSSRFQNADRKWIKLEFHEFKIFLGKLGSETSCSEVEWNKEIDTAERVLIDYCHPPYNSKKKDLISGVANDVVILNNGKRAKLPFTITTLWRESSLAKGKWKSFNSNMYNNV